MTKQPTSLHRVPSPLTPEDALRDVLAKELEAAERELAISHRNVLEKIATHHQHKEPKASPQSGWTSAWQQNKKKTEEYTQVKSFGPNGDSHSGTLPQSPTTESLGTCLGSVYGSESFGVVGQGATSSEEYCNHSMPSMEEEDSQYDGAVGLPAPTPPPKKLSIPSPSPPRDPLTQAFSWRRVSQDSCRTGADKLSAASQVFSMNQSMNTMNTINTQLTCATRVSESVNESWSQKKIEILPSWLDEGNELAKAKCGRVGRSTAVYRLYQRMKNEDAETEDGRREKPAPRCVDKAVINPCSVSRAGWDMCSLVLVLYECIALPLQLFEPPELLLFTVMEWITRLFWTCDCPLSFLTGFLMADGHIEMQIKAIVNRYLTSWFFLDISLVVMDWLEVWLRLSGSVGILRFGKATRGLRVLRLFRLLRIGKIWEIMKLVTFRIQSERLAIISDIIQILALVIGTTHIIACLWYAVGSSDSGAWADDFAQSSLGHKYLMSFHWALAQFNGGMDEVVALTTYERFFNVVVFLFAFLAAAMCVSSLTSSMTRLQILTSSQSRQLSVLRRYLMQIGVTDRLALRIQRNALHAIFEQERLMLESNVDLLRLISIPLRVELHYEMYSPVLEVHPFFELYAMEHVEVMCKVCHDAMRTLLVSFDDVIFNLGEIPDEPSMYIICNGSFTYFHHAGSQEHLQTEEWLAEAVLWTHWMHRGILRATSDGRLCLLDSHRFMHIVAQFNHVHFKPKSYGLVFVKYLNSQEPNEVTDLSCGLERTLLKKSGAPRQTMIQSIRMSSKQAPAFGRNRRSLFGSRRSFWKGGQFKKNGNTENGEKEIDTRRESVFFESAAERKSKRWSVMPT